MEWYGVLAIILASGVVTWITIVVVDAALAFRDEKRIRQYAKLVAESIDGYFDKLNDTCEMQTKKMFSTKKGEEDEEA